MSINEIICSLLRKERFVEPRNAFIKVQRSVIYNPDRRYLFEKIGRAQDLEAFEAFVFPDGHKLIVYGNGYVTLWNRCDEQVADAGAQEALLDRIKDHITVTDQIRL